MRLHLGYNFSRSSHDSPHVKIAADLAAPHEEVLAISGAVGSLPLIYGAIVCQNPQPNEQLEVGQP